MTGFLFSGGGSGVDWTNVKAYGATGDGTTDDTVAIQAAMDAAFAKGTTTLGGIKGGAVYFPPGCYKISSSLNVTNANGGKIRLLGPVAQSARIRGTVSGYLIDSPLTAGPCILEISDLYISNDSTAASSGAVRLGYSEHLRVNNCKFQGMIGLEMSGNTFNSVISNCEVSAGFNNHLPGSVGIYTGQTTVINTTVLGYETGMMIGGYTDGGVASGTQGWACIGSRIESCTTGLLIGKNINGASVSAGGLLAGFTTERCDTAIDINNGAFLTFNNVLVQGSLGVAQNVTNMSWASTSGGQVTVDISGQGATLNDYGWTSGDRSIWIQSANPVGYSTYPAGYVTGTYIDSTHFRYPLVSNPGSYSNGATWSFRLQYGIRFRNCQYSTVNNATAAFDQTPEHTAFYIGDISGDHVTFLDCLAGTWTMPTTTTKAGITFINCDNTAATLAYADLPGQTGVRITSPIEGMEYDITDGTIAGGAWGGIVTGGGSTHTKVRYNGTNWTAVGK